MINQLPGETALEIGHRRTAEHAAQNDGQRGPLVQVTVDHVGPEALGGPGGRDQEQEIETGLVDREADGQLAHPGEPHGPHRANRRDVPAEVVGRHQDLHVVATEGTDFLENPHVAAAVAEERRGRDHQHAHGSSRIGEAGLRGGHPSYGGIVAQVARLARRSGTARTLPRRRPSW